MQTDTILTILSNETGIDRNKLLITAAEKWPTLIRINAYLPIRMIQHFQDMVMMEVVKREIGWVK
jgi:hypothetical protein